MAEWSERLSRNPAVDSLSAHRNCIRLGLDLVTLICLLASWNSVSDLSP